MKEYANRVRTAQNSLAGTQKSAYLLCDSRQVAYHLVPPFSNL